MPELPDAKKLRFVDNYELAIADATALSADLELSVFFEQTMRAAAQLPAKPIANLLLNDISAYLNANSLTINQTALSHAGLAVLAATVNEGTISSKQAKEVLAELLSNGGDPLRIIEQRNMKQVSDAGELESVVDAILVEFPGKVAEYRDGKTGLIGFFVGQAMKATAGQGNPKLLNELFAAKLSQ
jgi:aspartyl-tRNA(Asn)/glutamyl-tRNA(Gln) amidotransferase subunit B